MTTALAAAAASPGLSSGDVDERRRRGLGNDYQPRTSRSVGEILRANLLTRFNALLGSMFVLILIVGPVQDSLFGLTLIVNTLIGVAQELRAKRTLDRLAVLTAPVATVIRDGERRVVPADQVVMDDLVELAPGDQVVVDARVIDERGLRLDESLLTGESEPIGKPPGAEVLAGSLVVAGSARCLVTAVGASSYAAKLESQARQFTVAPSELRDGINAILRVITWVLIPTAALLFWSQLTQGRDLEDAIRGAVAGTVTMVPEGLILLASIAFAVGAMRLARRRVLSRELVAIEGLARVDMLCIDKTGTLTSGHLVVAHVEELTPDQPLAEALGGLARISARLNTTAAAIADRFPADDTWRAQHTYPFSSETKWSGADFGGHGIWLLGAPEALGLRTDEQRQQVEAVASTGARVLLLARATDTGHPVESSQPVALVTLRDELRTDAAATLRYLEEQGVGVRVLSGDHPRTVASIAQSVGLPAGVPIDARSIGEDTAQLVAAAEETVVFGRVTPDQKRAIVEGLQAQGHVVAMTGDGVNDVLALKSADVGIALGSGSAATRAVAQLVLLDDAFTAIPQVVAEGRRVIANMERVANLFLTKTVYATVLALTVGIMRLPFPFLPRHLTLVSTLTIGVPAFFLALAPNAKRARPGFVSRVVRFAVPTGLVAAAATYLAYAEAREDKATSLTQARTLSTIVLFAIAVWVLAILVRLAVRRQAWLVPTMIAAMILVLSLPATRTFFALALPRPLVLLAGVGAAALAGFALEAGWVAAGWMNKRPKAGADRADSPQR